MMKSDGTKRETPTLHNQAEKGQIAECVLMPGDPQRARFIAENYLADARLVSEVRGIYAYTGSCRGRKVSVMASGMGAGSMGIYSYELFQFYGVEKIIRVGSAGGLSPHLALRDIVIGTASSTDTGYALQYGLPGTLAPCGDFGLARKAFDYAEKKGLGCRAGMLFSGEAFYYEEEILRKWAQMGALAVEMESAALYMNAAKTHKKALAICTISDLVFSGEKCSVEERQNSFDDMIKMALSIIT
ncbi:purine-nucleoside phosphorylase [Lactonifactor longoviformis]|uniref:Uridine phosphorylase n=1 Tax=Lactonifactor longoviformis DSM 17459 TaxID=1122155 RepID=A0A1M4V2E6_9CLOT|nr:purine-nucleoside phosphorylase [Lactonifactor longoviformis]SHE63164.1 purine-nucleoside phosphorylase [Lactonifactor longoviformis DSM 17459]